MLKRPLINIQQIVNPVKFQKIQDDISSATGLAIITVDYKGTPITAHSNCSEFCKKVRSSDMYLHYCEKCDSRGGLEAARIQKPFIYFCHAGIIDLAIPIIVDDLYLGAFMAGQVLLEQEDEANRLERILSGVRDTIDLSHDEELSESYALLPVMRLEKIIALSNMLSHIGQYCVEEAILRATVAQLSSRNNTFEFYNETEHKLENVHLKSNFIAEYRSKTPNKVLQPAIDYIRQHTDEKITLSKMSALCNVSSSYFSKLFAKENLSSLSDFVNHVKVDRAKELLHSTEWPIRCIAENLGFDDCGYFIKVFKGDVGKTPAEFRKCYHTAEEN